MFHGANKIMNMLRMYLYKKIANYNTWSKQDKFKMSYRLTISCNITVKTLDSTLKAKNVNK